MNTTPKPSATKNSSGDFSGPPLELFPLDEDVFVALGAAEVLVVEDAIAIFAHKEDRAWARLSRYTRMRRR